MSEATNLYAPLVLTIDGVKKAARDRYDAGTLQAQMTCYTGGCAYRTVDPEDEQEYCCGVGAAMPTEFLDMIERLELEDTSGNEANVASLINAGLLVIEGGEDYASNLVFDIQAAHDDWAQSSKFEDCGDNEFKALFLQLIDHPSAKQVAK